MKSHADVGALLSRLHAEEFAVYKDGQMEYAHDEANALANFERAAAELGLTREQVLLVYGKKHWDGIAAWVCGHRSQREAVQGRIKDLRLYLALLQAMAEDGEPVPGCVHHGPLEATRARMREAEEKADESAGWWRPVPISVETWTGAPASYIPGEDLED